MDGIDRLVRAVDGVLLGKGEAVRLVVAALVADGHVLLEDVPGTGKTTLARALALAMGGEFRRIQFTSDLLPSDVTGTSVHEGGEFRFVRGPVFANVVLADELNRTTPRTQSALLEALNESQVTIDGVSHALPRPFLVIATQNPLEFEGTYPLPESQLDRFLLRVTPGYPDRDAERALLERDGSEALLGALRPVLDAREVLEAQVSARRVRVDAAIGEYLLDVIERTRSDGAFLMGASPRAALGLRRAAQAWALLEGRDYVVPHDVKRMVIPVLSHRLIGRSRDGVLEVEERLAVLLDGVAAPR